MTPALSMGLLTAAAAAVPPATRARTAAPVITILLVFMLASLNKRWVGWWAWQLSLSGCGPVISVPWPVRMRVMCVNGALGYLTVGARVVLHDALLGAGVRRQGGLPRLGAG
jgi:hypothetical protein